MIYFCVELTDNLIAAQAFVFFLAGFETSSTTLSFCLHELALNKAIQDDVYSEISAVVKKYGEPLGYDSLKDLVLLEQCLLGKDLGIFNISFLKFQGLMMLLFKQKQ